MSKERCRIMQLRGSRIAFCIYFGAAQGWRNCFPGKFHFFFTAGKIKEFGPISRNEMVVAFSKDAWASRWHVAS